MKWCVAFAACWVACYQPRSLTATTSDGAPLDVRTAGSDVGMVTDTMVDSLPAACSGPAWQAFDDGDPTMEIVHPPDGLPDWVDEGGFSFGTVNQGVWSPTTDAGLATNPDPGIVAEAHLGVTLSAGDVNATASVIVALETGAGQAERVQIDVVRTSASTQSASGTDVFGGATFFSEASLPTDPQVFTIDIVGKLATVHHNGTPQSTALTLQSMTVLTRTSLEVRGGGGTFRNVGVLFCP